MGQGVFFFVVAPFCSCPASLVSRKFFAVGPGCAKCFFFLLRSVGHRDLSAGRGQSKKKNTTQGVFFLLRPREKAGEGEAPLGAGTGPFCICSGPVPAVNGASPSPAFPRGTLGGVFFFALAPCRRPTGLLLPLPFAGAAAKKNTLGGVFFLLWPRAGTGLLLPCLSPGPEQKKKTPWVVFFFFLLRPRADAHSLTAGLGGDASPSPGWCFLFAAAPPGPGWCFFFFAVAPPGRSLTHCGLGRFRQGPGGAFFLLRPRRVFLDNSKKCLGYYIGSKKTRRGHSKKKNTTSKIMVPFWVP